MRVEGGVYSRKALVDISARGVGVVIIRAWVHIQGNKVTSGALKCHLISYNAMLLINLLYVVCILVFIIVLLKISYLDLIMATTQ